MMLRCCAWRWRRRHVISRLTRRFGIALISALLASMVGGCAWLDRPDLRLQGAKSIGVVSAIGDEFTFSRAGLTMPADAERHFSILSWGLDDLVTVRAGVLLGKRYQVQSLTYSRAPFAERAAVSAFAVKNLLSSRDRNSRIVDLVRTEVAPQGLDLYVVVTKGEASYGSRNRTVTGIGAIDRVAVFGSSGQLHALFTITVIDGHMLKVISRRQAGPIEDGEDLYRLRGPSREVGADLVSAAQNADGSNELKAAVIDLIDRGLARTLQELQLVDQPKP